MKHGIRSILKAKRYHTIPLGSYKWNNPLDMDTYTAKLDLNKLSTRHLIAIGNAVGKSAGQVLDELIELELEADGLNGL